MHTLKLAKEVRKRLMNDLGQPLNTIIMFSSQAHGDAPRVSRKFGRCIIKTPLDPWPNLLPTLRIPEHLDIAWLRLFDHQQPICFESRYYYIFCIKRHHFRIFQRGKRDILTFYREG
jgi:hypothetical protein